MKLKMNDVSFSMNGFSVVKVKRVSDSKLMLLEERLTDEVYSTDWSNVDDLGYLYVSWLHTQDLSQKEKQTVLNVLNDVLNS